MLKEGRAPPLAFLFERITPLKTVLDEVLKAFQIDHRQDFVLTLLGRELVDLESSLEDLGIPDARAFDAEILQLKRKRNIQSKN